MSFAPFFHLALFARALRSFPEIVGSGVAEDDAIGGEGRDVKELLEHVESDEVPLRSRHNPWPPTGHHCSFLAMARLLASADAQRLHLGLDWRGQAGQSVLKLLSYAQACIHRSMRSFAPQSFVSRVAASSVP